ncbi:MAG: ABC transporter ATP-binding protein [Afipia sp.]|nr:ABC transporter ATP-binding protein [Afipia sp.]
MLALLEVDGLSAFYGHLRALSDISLTVEAGELVSIIGSNGAGKTTCLRALSGLIATTGSIRFDGQSLAGQSPQDIVGLGVVHCPEGRKLFPDMTVGENLSLGAFLRSDRAAIRSDLERVNALFPILHERREQKAGTLSGGEQQMLAIGRALMCRPRILLLDEPSFGIAPIIVDRIFEVIQQLNADGLTTLLVEQNVTLALDVCSRAYVLENGHVVLAGSSSDIAADKTVRETYLGM